MGRESKGSQLSKFRRAFLAVTLIASSLAAVGLFSGQADAFCGWGGVRATLHQNGGTEKYTHNNTCDGDNWYNGKVLDAVHDGACVQAQWDTNGWPNEVAYNCSETTWVTNLWSDSDQTSQVRICRDNNGCGAWKPHNGY